MKVSSVKLIPEYNPNYKPAEKSLSSPPSFKGHAVRYATKSKSVNNNIGLVSLIAGAVLVTGALLTYFMSRKKSTSGTAQKEKTYTKDELQREWYTNVQKPYPNLSVKYTQMTEKAATEPNDKENKTNLETYEKILGIIARPKNLPYYRTYFEALNSDYIGDFDNILTDFRINENNGGSSNRFLALINNGRISSEELADWANHPQVDCDEYKVINDLPEEKKLNVYKFKENNNVKIINIARAKTEPTYAFKLEFSDETTLEYKMHKVTELFQVLNGEIKENSVAKNGDTPFTTNNIRTKIFKRINLDKSLESVYNIARFLNYDDLKYHEYTSYELVEKYEQGIDTSSLRNIIRSAVRNANIRSKQINDFVSIMNDKSYFSDLFGSNHARFRFISRVVLNNNHKVDLKQEFVQKINELKIALDKRLNGNSAVFPHRFDALLPSLYVPLEGIKGKLKIVLGKDGKIYTLYEEAYTDKNEKNQGDDLSIQT